MDGNNRMATSTARGLSMSTYGVKAERNSGSERKSKTQNWEWSLWIFVLGLVLLLGDGRLRRSWMLNAKIGHKHNQIQTHSTECRRDEIQKWQSWTEAKPGCFVFLTANITYKCVLFFISVSILATTYVFFGSQFCIFR